MFIHSGLTQHVSGIIMPIVRRTEGSDIERFEPKQVQHMSAELFWF